jgi:outer membrane protein OmpA-like peptidoglycan-associated protein/tetratricopeptide (TPR) repeat protein
MRNQHNLVTFFVFILILVNSASAQLVNVEFRERNFPEKEEAFKKAFAAFKQGDYYFLRGPVYFEQALENYLIAQEFNPDNADLNYQIGYCYLNLQTNRLKALPYLERAKLLNQNMGSEFLYSLGKAYQYSLDFDNAMQVFEAYKATIDTLKNADSYAKALKAMDECMVGKELVKKPIRVRIDNLGAGVNTKFPEYSPVLSEDETKLMFTSRRDETTGKMVDAEDSLFFEDIYVTYKIDNEWAPAKNIGKPINTEEHDATINLSVDGKKLLIYRTTNGGDVFESRQDGIEWSEPKPIREINTKYYENHAAYSTDGKYLFFISNRKDSISLGGKDIYMAEVASNGSIYNVKNAGSVINTPFDEEGVFCHPDGKTVYFSSHGHRSMGGYDIFKSTFNNGVWTTPENLGYPINTPEDDAFFVVSKDGRRAYFASYREEGFGDKDIYVMNFLTDAEALSSLQFVVFDPETGKPMQAVVEIKDIATGNVIIKRETENAETIANLQAGKTYEITVNSLNYLPYTEVLYLPFETSNQILTRKIELGKDEQAIVSGQLVDGVRKIPVSGEVEFLDSQTREVVKETRTSKSGNFDVTLPPDHDYIMEAKANGYVFHSDSIKIDGTSKGKRLTHDVNLMKLDRTLMSVLKGNILDAVTKKPLSGQISITEYGEQALMVYQKPGEYDCIVFNGASLTLIVNAEGYMTYMAEIVVPLSKEKQQIIHNVSLVKAEKGAKIVLNNIFFDFNKSTLRPASYSSLSNLLALMNRYPNMAIEISGHTDNIGSMDYNQNLSDSRAQVVKDYLLKNGISAKKVNALGRSFKQPIATNDTPEGRQLNRRTEIKILSMN